MQLKNAIDDGHLSKNTTVQNKGVSKIVRNASAFVDNNDFCLLLKSVLFQSQNAVFSFKKINGYLQVNLNTEY